jgi:HPt (histidine-containing phosphotransfer) domain-containing protein
MDPSEPAVLDEGVLGQLLDSVDGDRAFVADLAEAYLTDSATHRDGIRAAVDASDADALVRPAHTLKSSSATVGAMAVSRTARELEMAGRSGSLDATVPGLVERLDDEWAQTESALRAWLARE